MVAAFWAWFVKVAGFENEDMGKNPLFLGEFQ
jgi:hypothetical protein